MKDAVLISIHRKWVEKIASGEKVLEIRKNFPRLKPPFKCYVYETKKDGGRGAVVMEFECMYTKTFYMCDKMDAKWVSALSKVPLPDLYKYAKGDAAVGWRISRVKCYDKPKDPFDFGINRIPQSWCYVEEVL